MNKRKFFTGFFAVLIGVVVLVAVFAAVRYFTMKTAVVVCDLSFDGLLPDKFIHDTKRELLGNQIRLKWVVLDGEQLTDQQKFESAIMAAKNADFVLLSPVITYAAEQYGIEAYSLLGTVVAGISDKTESSAVNYMLKSDTTPAWNSIEDKDAICIKSFIFKEPLDFDDKDAKYIADYRCMTMVPEERLEAVICPDIVSAVLNIPEDGENGVLNYVCFKI